MIAHLLERPVIHFGAGSLGRGLVIPVLAANGAQPVLVDTDPALVEALRASRGYALHIGNTREEVRIADAFLPGDPALAPLLAASRLVTTSVREPNLGGVASVLAGAWRSTEEARLLVACENVAGSSRLLRDLTVRAGLAPNIVTAPDCVVDRICAARWPADLGVETERTLEWSIEGTALAGIRLAETVPDIRPRFARKRYLVNSFADAVAFLGVRRGCRTLHEAAADASIVATVSPLIDALRGLLVRRDGFDPSALAAYEAATRRRLADASIARPIETVARDLRRKMAAEERFIEPLRALEELGQPVDRALDVIALLLDQPPVGWRAILALLERDWPDAPWAHGFLDALRQRLETSNPTA